VYTRPSHTTSPCLAELQSTSNAVSVILFFLPPNVGSPPRPERLQRITLCLHLERPPAIVFASQDLGVVHTASEEVIHDEACGVAEFGGMSRQKGGDPSRGILAGLEWYENGMPYQQRGSRYLLSACPALGQTLLLVSLRT